MVDTPELKRRAAELGIDAIGVAHAAPYDGTERVIYTGPAILALYVSPNDDAVEDVTGEDAPDWSKLAFCAVWQDVADELGNFGDLFGAENEDEDEDNA